MCVHLRPESILVTINDIQKELSKAVPFLEDNQYFWLYVWFWKSFKNPAVVKLFFFSANRQYVLKSSIWVIKHENKH